MQKVKSLKVSQRKLVLQVLTKSLGLTEDGIYSMSYADVIMLFLKVWKANSEISDFLGKK